VKLLVDMRQGAAIRFHRSALSFLLFPLLDRGVFPENLTWLTVGDGHQLWQRRAKEWR
jgi:hypothetical protein